jgi:uncharacterized ion transporter superfamily protein YfcC
MSFTKTLKTTEKLKLMKVNAAIWFLIRYAEKLNYNPNTSASNKTDANNRIEKQ